MRTMAEIYADIMEGVKKSAEKAEAAAGPLIDLLAAAGIESVHIEFSGCGDSGNIDEIGCIPPTAAFNQEIEEWVNELLSGTGVDWYNNDGGQGEVTIDVTNRTYDYRVDQNYTESETTASGSVTV